MEVYLLGKTSTASKERWNSTNYTQVKISVRPETAAEFKAACCCKQYIHGRRYYLFHEKV